MIRFLISKINHKKVRPCKARCDECRMITITHMRKIYNFYAYLLAFLIVYIYGLLFAIPLMIIIIPLCQNIVHDCPNCGGTLLELKFCNIKLQEKNVILK